MTATVDEYIDNLPEDRRIAIRAVREAVNAKLPPGYEEGIVYGMIAWFVPFTRLAETHNGQPLCVASLGAQKSHMALYLQSVYGDPALNEWFQKAWKGTGKKLDMGKSCIRFKKLDDLALDVISEAISRVSVDQYVASYEQIRANTAEGKAAAGKAAAAKAKAKEVVAKVESKAKAVVAKAASSARAAEGKAKAVVEKVESKAKQVAGKAKEVAGKAKQVAAKATAAASARGKAAGASAKNASKTASTKAKAASAKAKTASAKARTKLVATAARAKASAKKSPARA